MKYFIDTASISEIEKWSRFVEGATCNPSLLRKEGMDDYTFYINNVHLFKNIFIQVNSINDVEYLDNKQADFQKLIFKVPLVKTNDYDGYKLLKVLTQNKLRTCSTIVYDISQFDYACEVGSESSIVLYAKNDNSFIVNECCHLKEKKGYETKIVAASFRSAEHVFDCIKAGAEYGTVPPKIMKDLFSNEKAINDYKDFYELI
ncbi:MAG: hypothetical protein K9L62_10455 [Vallitaleaceae bacterium]|nr:hypothetical protein [Vallitaleaceae bacterium]